MNITLGTRTEESVKIYFNKTSNDTFPRWLPQKAQTVDEAIADYKKTLLPQSTSYGRTILADGNYVGDIWCYCIDLTDTPNAMVSYCLFESDFWGKGIATAALGLFIDDVMGRFHFKTLGAFTFSDNAQSIRVLEKNGFEMVEEFTEDGVQSKYFEFHAE